MYYVRVLSYSLERAEGSKACWSEWLIIKCRRSKRIICMIRGYSVSKLLESRTKLGECCMSVGICAGRSRFHVLGWFQFFSYSSSSSSSSSPSSIMGLNVARFPSALLLDLCECPNSSASSTESEEEDDESSESSKSLLPGKPFL